MLCEVFTLYLITISLPKIVTACLEVTDAIVAINPSAYYGSLYVNIISGKLLEGFGRFCQDLLAFAKPCI